MKQISTLFIFIIFNTNFLFGQLTVREVYDFEIGNIFQYQVSQYVGYWNYQLKLIDKSFSPNKDTVYYKWAKLVEYPGETTEYKYDTIYTFYSELDMEMIDYLLIHDLKINHDSLKKYYQFKPSNEWQDDTTYRTRAFIDTTVTFELGGKTFWTVSYHVKYGPIHFENPSARKVCGKGIGDCAFGKSSGQPNDFNHTQLVYIEKGNEVFGNKAVGVIDTETFNEIAIYPIPTTGILYFNEPDVKSVSIYDLSGKLLLKETVSESIDITSLENGTYLLKTSNDNELKMKRIIKI